MDNFINQTAKDYDMDIEFVQSIYDRFYHQDPKLFYSELEIYAGSRGVQNNQEFDKG